MINIATRQFEEDLVHICNTSPLPTELKRVIFENVCLKLEMQADKDIAKERANEQSTHKDSVEELPTN